MSSIKDWFHDSTFNPTTIIMRIVLKCDSVGRIHFQINCWSFYESPTQLLNSSDRPGGEVSEYIQTGAVYQLESGLNFRLSKTCLNVKLIFFIFCH